MFFSDNEVLNAAFLSLITLVFGSEKSPSGRNGMPRH